MLEATTNFGVMGTRGYSQIFVAMVFVLSLNVQTSDTVTMPYIKGDNEKPATGEDTCIYISTLFIFVCTYMLIL